MQYDIMRSFENHTKEVKGMDQINEFLARLTCLIREISELIEVADCAKLQLKDLEIEKPEGD